MAFYLLTEYGAKQWLETAVRRGLSVGWYVDFRLAHFLLNLAGTAFLAGLDARAGAVVAAAAVVELLGAAELPLAALDRFLRRRTGAHVRWLQALPLAGIWVWTMHHAESLDLSRAALGLLGLLERSLPGVAIDPAHFGWYVLGYAFLASPANHLVRCFVGKSPEGQLAYLVRWRRAAGVRPGAEPELAAARDADGAGDSSGEAIERSTLLAGRVIGALERWIMLSLALLGQFSLIGLVLTAKSIARFKRIEQDPEFAEYYLMGTLYSTLIALACGMVLTRV